jgi:hypothetical protein
LAGKNPIYNIKTGYNIFEKAASFVYFCGNYYSKTKGLKYKAILFYFMGTETGLAVKRQQGNDREAGGTGCWEEC